MAAKAEYTDVIDYDTSQAHTGDIKYAQNMPKQPCFISYDKSFRKIIGGNAKIILIEQRTDKFAHEAGVCIKSTNKNYFTSNYQSGKTIELYAVDCDTHEITEDKFDQVVTANGGKHMSFPIVDKYQRLTFAQLAIGKIKSCTAVRATSIIPRR